VSRRLSRNFSHHLKENTETITNVKEALKKMVAKHMNEWPLSEDPVGSGPLDELIRVRPLGNRHRGYRHDSAEQSRDTSPVSIETCARFRTATKSQTRTIFSAEFMDANRRTHACRVRSRMTPEHPFLETNRLIDSWIE
jgi:hypothetical protein